MLITPGDVDRAHKHCIRHRPELGASTLCGCFCCLETFIPDEITDWTDEGDTALCPNCGIDSVIGDASGFPVTPEFLAAMERRWFGLRDAAG
jgi:hypothetical protein